MIGPEDQEIIEWGWLIAYELKIGDKIVGTVIVNDYDGTEHIDWGWLLKNMASIKTKGTVSFPFKIEYSRPLLLARNLWTCACPETEPFIHTSVTPICLRCNTKGENNTFRLPYAELHFNWKYEITHEEAIKKIREKTKLITSGSDREQ